LDQQVFCYFGLPEQIHSDQGAQFQSQLMSDLCRLWGINQSGMTPYHPQGNGVVERNNRMLGDSLRSLLIGRSQEEWDTVLPQIMRAYRSTPHFSTLETPNFLMLGRETRVPEHVTYHVPAPESNFHDYVDELVTTQPLRVVVTRTGRTITEDDKTPTTTISYIPGRPKRKKKDPSVAKENANPDRSILADLRKMQKRINRLCKEQKKLTTDMNKLRDRLEQRLAARP